MKAEEKFRERLSAGCNRIKGLIADYEASGRTDINSLIDPILKTLVDYGLAFKQRFKPEFVGVHPANRGGTGLVASSMQSLLEFILINGWSWRMVLRACAFEIKPGSAKEQRFNEAIV